MNNKGYKEDYVDYEEIQDPRDSIITIEEDGLHVNTLSDTGLVEETYKNDEERKRAEIQEMMSNEDFQRTFMRLHTPLRATKLPGRNDVCPYCSSGKKFKNCECYKTHKVEYRNKYFKD